MFADLELAFPSNWPFMLVAAMGVVVLALSFRKKERILASFHLGGGIRLKALRAALLGAGLGLMAFSLLMPQVFTGFAQVEKTGLDIYVLMDTSKSMLTTDIEPDRLTVAKRIVGDLLDQLEGDRIGFIPFASDAYVQMPLTDDYELARMFLDVMDTDMISGGGTNLAAAMRLAGDSFERTTSADRVLLILSDGEDHGAASLSALKGLTDERLKIYAIGIGTEKGGLVPVYGDDGKTVANYMRDSGGNPVTSRLMADTLRELAQGGRGSYFQATLRGEETAGLLGAISTLRRDALETGQISRYEPLYQWFLGAGIALFSLGWFLPERRVAA